MPNEGFYRTERRNLTAEDSFQCIAFRSIIAGSACAVNVDVINLFGRDAACGNGLTHREERAVAFGRASGLVVSVIGIGIATEFAVGSGGIVQ